MPGGDYDSGGGTQVTVAAWKFPLEDAVTDGQRGVTPLDAVIIGGCGRVGLPLGISLASRGLSVVLYDINAAAVATVNSGVLPFAEEGAAELLAGAVGEGRLRASTDPASVSAADTIVVIVGTPVDEHLNPDIAAVPLAIERCADFLRHGQLMILRSTVHPGVTALTEKMLARRSLQLDVALVVGLGLFKLFGVKGLAAHLEQNGADTVDRRKIVGILVENFFKLGYGLFAAREVLL